MTSRLLGRGFTLVELLIAVTIIGVLASLLLPAITGTRRTGPQTQCMGNLRQLGMAFDLYAQDYERERPMELTQLHPIYVSQAELFLCAADPWQPRGGWYGLFADCILPPPMRPSLPASYGYFGLVAGTQRQWERAQQAPGRPGYVVCVVHGERCGRGESPPFYHGKTLRLCFDGSVTIDRIEYDNRGNGNCQFDVWLACTGERLKGVSR